MLNGGTCEACQQTDFSRKSSYVIGVSGSKCPLRARAGPYGAPYRSLWQNKNQHTRMSINLLYPDILNLFKEYLDPHRSESASMLIWYFENYLRLDALEAVDSVCDQRGDKGIDGIYVNEVANVIEIYQSKISQREAATIGDTVLKEFEGTLSQFDSIENLENLIATCSSPQVVRLIRALEITRRLPEFEIRGIFVCNSEIDGNGSAYLATNRRIRFVGKSELEGSFLSSQRSLPITAEFEFDVSGFDTAKYVVDATNEAILAPLRASQLVTLEGLANQNLFAYNVRGSLGRTQVNKDISASIRDATTHKLFPLFHNGITVIASEVSGDEDKIRVKDYFVVNGCQSLTALHTNSGSITDELRILTKIVKASPDSSLAEMVTRFSNNQNGVKARDFKSNNKIQIRLQNEIRGNYSNEFSFEIKRGESTNDREVISNELSGLYLMAFDSKHPWGTHRKYQVFEELHADLFGRPSVTAHRIVMCHLLYKLAEVAVSKLSNGLISKYALTRFLLLYIIRLLLENDAMGIDAIAHPEKYVLDKARRAAFLSSVETVLDEVVTDMNAELDRLPEDFDYRGKLRDQDWADKLAHEIVATHEKLVARRRLESIEDLFNTALIKAEIEAAAAAQTTLL